MTNPETPSFEDERQETEPFCIEGAWLDGIKQPGPPRPTYAETLELYEASRTASE